MSKKGVSIICPVCGSKDIGILRQGLWFCRSCYCELTKKNEKIIAYGIDQDGSLKKIDKTA